MTLNGIKNNKTVMGFIVAIFSAMIFGVYPSAAKAVYADGGNIVLVVLATTFVRFIALYIVALIMREKPFPKNSQNRMAYIAGFFQALSVIGLMGGAYFLPASVVIIIMFTYSLMLLFVSVWRGDMALNIVNITATILGLVGLALVLNVFDATNTYSLVGIGLAFMAAIATCIRVYIFAKQGQARSPVVVGAEIFFIASILLIPLMIWETPQLPQTDYGFVMLAVCCASLALASFGMFYGAAMLGAYKFSIVMKLEPLFTVLFGIYLLNEFLVPAQYIGMALVLLSIISIQMIDKQKQQ
jgi:drug/metabolite transporter (DMT)-like permease